MTDAAGADLTIGRIARAAGVNVETVRYYERIGLLPRPQRSEGTIRRYPAQALQRVRFIKRAQWLGFSLEEIAMLLSLSERGSCSDARSIGDMKLSLLRQKLDELARIGNVLEELLSQCAAPHGQHCPLIDALLADDGPVSRSPAVKPAQPMPAAPDTVHMTAPDPKTELTLERNQ